jgi:protein phosphatase methylesterase 1
MNINVDEEKKPIFSDEQMFDLKIEAPDLFHLLQLPYHDLDSPQQKKIDWSIEGLKTYLMRVINHVRYSRPNSNIVLVGHSLGGSIAVKTLDMINKEPELKGLSERVVGILVIDVVEGSALEALPHMHIIVKNR